MLPPVKYVRSVSPCPSVCHRHESRPLELTPSAPSSKSGFGGSMRPPPVNLPGVHPPPSQKLGRRGASEVGAESWHAAATSPAASRLSPTKTLLCWCSMFVLPSVTVDAVQM